MSRFVHTLVALLILFALHVSPARAAAPPLTLTWRDTQQLAVSWTWHAGTQEACGFIHRETGQTIFLECVQPTDAPQLTLPPGAPPWDALYRAQIGDRIEVRFYLSALIYESAEAVVTSGPPRIWLPITREK